MFNLFLKDLAKSKINYNISKKTWFGTGGNAKIFTEINSMESLTFFLKILPKSFPIFLIGAGSNTIIRDGGINGFTIKLGKSFKKIDFDYPLAIAKLAFQNGAKSIAIVSAIGAKEGSPNYYFHIKGKLENAIREIGFKNVCIAQPSHLLGKRNDFRGHEIPFLEGALNISAPLMQGPLKNFRQIEAERVAKAMILELRKNYGRVKILRYKDF